MLDIQCIICDGQLEFLSNKKTINRTVKCKICGFTNLKKKREPEIIIRKGNQCIT